MKKRSEKVSTTVDGKALVCYYVCRNASEGEGKRNRIHPSNATAYIKGGKDMILYPHEKGNVKVLVDRNFQSKHFCIKCGTDARNLNGQREFGYYERGTKGWCKTCNSRIKYLY